MDAKKRVGFIAGAGLGAAAAVALRRRWAGESAASSEASRAPVTDPGEAGASFLAHLRAAIAMRTVSHEDTWRVDSARFEEFRSFLASAYPLAHDRLEVELVAEHSLLFTWTGVDEAAAPIVLMAHQDVVPVEPGTEPDWELPPFDGAEDERYLYGRGSLDDKASLIGILQAVEGLLREGFRPRTTVYLAFGHDEEAGGSGAKAIATLLADREVHCSLVLDEGGAVAVDFFPGVEVPVALIGIGEKGSINVRLTARGPGGHPSAPPDRTAIGLLGSAVAALEREPMPARLDAQRGFLEVLGGLISGPQGMALKRPDRFASIIEQRFAARPVTNALIRTTGAATIVSGGIRPNVLPRVATAIVNFRIIPGDTVDGVLAHVREVVGEDIEVSMDESRFGADPPDLADPESPQFELIARLARDHCAAEAVAPWIVTGATDSRHFVPIADQVLRFVPLTATPDDLSRLHGTGERIRRADADGVVAFYRALLQRIGHDG